MTLPRNVQVSNESDHTCDEAALAELAGYLFGALRLHPDCELGITMVDAERMTTLHEDWMHEPGPTDVLSFPIDELVPGDDDAVSGPGMLGDIVLCPEYLPAQMAESGRSLDEELQFLTTHGTLHLLGYDHQTPDEHTAMFALQDRLLAGWQAR